MDSYREGKENSTYMNRGKGIGLVKVGRMRGSEKINYRYFCFIS